MKSKNDSIPASRSDLCVGNWVSWAGGQSEVKFRKRATRTLPCRLRTDMNQYSPCACKENQLIDSARCGSVGGCPSQCGDVPTGQWKQASKALSYRRRLFARSVVHCEVVRSSLFRFVVLESLRSPANLQKSPSPSVNRRGSDARRGVRKKTRRSEFSTGPALRRG